MTVADIVIASPTLTAVSRMVIARSSFVSGAGRLAPAQQAAEKHSLNSELRIQNSETQAFWACLVSEFCILNSEFKFSGLFSATG
jgi:hypothetical protein